MRYALPKERAMPVIAHISDPHLDGSPRTSARAERVVRYLATLSDFLAAVVLTGDVSDHGAADEYTRAAELFALPVPVWCCPGNHDDRAEFRRALLGGEGDAATGSDPINQAYDLPGLTILLADSTVPGEDYGMLAPPTLDWLRARLASATQPALIALHHPPVDIGHPAVDGDQGLRNRAALAAIIRDAPHVAGILAGHVHTGAASSFAGVPVRVAPGIASTIVMPWERATAQEVFANPDAPPGLCVHVVEGMHLTTHIRAFDAPASAMRG
jgi:Icc protein